MLGWELPPFNSGGLGVACYQLCRALAKADVDIEFIVPYAAEHGINFMAVTPATTQDGETFLRAGASAYNSSAYLGEDGRVMWPNVFDQQQVFEQAVVRLAESRDFDIIHAHDWLTFRAALRIKEHSGKPLIVHVHSLESDRAGGNPGNPLVHEIEGLTFLLADKIVAVSQHTKRAIMQQYGVPADKIEVSYNSFDRDLLVPSMAASNDYRYLTQLKNMGYKVVASVGRLTVQKGLPNLLVAFAEVVRRLPCSLLLIVGSGEQQHELIERSAELGIATNVLFADFQRGKRYREAFTIADLFVMPSVSEPFGIAALEAVGYGTPVLLSHQTGAGEVLKNSLRVDFWDVKAMANAIVAVLQNLSLGTELQIRASEELQHISWDNSASQIIDLYQRHAARKVAA